MNFYSIISVYCLNKENPLNTKNSEIFEVWTNEQFVLTLSNLPFSSGFGSGFGISFKIPASVETIY
jgi:hypothetical protein